MALNEPSNSSKTTKDKPGFYSKKWNVDSDRPRCQSLATLKQK